MEKIIYLKNGERAILHQELAINEFVVEKLYLYNDRHDEDGSGEPYEEPSGMKIIVDKIFDTAPIQSIDKLYADKYKAFEKLSVSVRTLTSELQTLRNDVYKEKVIQTNLSKLIFNKSQLKTAKTIHYFIDDKIMPELMTDYAKQSMKMTLEVSVYSDSIRAWSYRLYVNDNSWGSSDKVDDTYGFLFDLTDEELDKAIIERVKTKQAKDFYAGYLSQIDNKYLTDELIQIKDKFKSDQVEKQIAECRKTIELKTTELNLLLDK